MATANVEYGITVDTTYSKSTVETFLKNEIDGKTFTDVYGDGYTASVQSTSVEENPDGTLYITIIAELRDGLPDVLSPENAANAMIEAADDDPDVTIVSINHLERW